jgi:chromatin remodeling complex protein RSC6
MDPQEAEYFKWLLRKCKVNLNTEQNKDLIAEIDTSLKKLLGTYGDEIHRYQEEEPKE